MPVGPGLLNPHTSLEEVEDGREDVRGVGSPGNWPHRTEWGASQSYTYANTRKHTRLFGSPIGVGDSLFLV